MRNKDIFCCDCKNLVRTNDGFNMCTPCKKYITECDMVKLRKCSKFISSKKEPSCMECEHGKIIEPMGDLKCDYFKRTIPTADADLTCKGFMKRGKKCEKDRKN